MANKATRARQKADISIRKSRFAPWRAGTLALVYVLMAVHILHWRLSGKTVAPVELNEVMYTLELGIITVGFLFMLVAVVGTGVFGRFFCSWGCHILALQDLSAWVLRKLHVRPRPIRSRLLLWVPMCAMLYMFAWPTAARLWVGHDAPELHAATDAEGWASFETSNFWRNLPGPGMIALTFATVGFGIVYVLGSRGFCLYGCPYGAVFGLVDRVAPGKIRVNDKCQQCGTCTAACSSGVRVHEEVARYGMVVSPTCLKDLDCVGVCPHGALSYGFGRPTLAKTVRSDRPVRKQYDFAWWEDGLMAVVLLAVLFIYRGLYDLLPFLMTLGLGAIAAYSCVALLRLTRGREVRVNRVVLRHDGRMRPVGWAFVAMMIVFGVVTVHSAAMQYHSRQGRRYYHLVQAGASAASASEAGAVAADASARAAAHLGVVDRWGLVAVDRHLGMLADLSVRAQRWQDADAYYTRLLSRNPGSAQVLAGYATALMGLKQPDRAVAALRAALDLQPESANTHYALAGALFDMRRFAEARHHLDEAVRIDPNLVHAHYDLGALLVEQGEFESGIEHLRVAVKLAPDFADAHYNLGVALAMTGRLAEAKRAIDHAGQLNPNDAQTVAFRAYLDQQSLGGATAIGRSP